MTRTDRRRCPQPLPNNTSSHHYYSFTDLNKLLHICKHLNFYHLYYRRIIERLQGYLLQLLYIKNYINIILYLLYIIINYQLSNEKGDSKLDCIYVCMSGNSEISSKPNPNAPLEKIKWSHKLVDSRFVVSIKNKLIVAPVDLLTAGTYLKK